MKKQWWMVAALAAAGSAAQAHELYAGVGLPGLVELGYAFPMARNWGVRAEFAGGLKADKNGEREGVNYLGEIRSNRVGLLADWFPFESGFRLVGGLTVNDIKANLRGVGAGTATINSKTVDMTGETFNVDVRFPSVTPYVGIGYGHHLRDTKGWGFHADLGVMVGSFNTKVETTLVDSGKVDQADIDAETQDLRDSLNSHSILPSLSLGVTYTY
ncbi:hypothetical protein [Candidatus Symbiobacter mobilis]|uniref:Outer membrane protein n=1 Tax=Candidatus Symbiobacter mobilis CR TaxID=946483 RepID=U5NAY3_9BURK|nr:hypothetical protein [Candidatus Symbiobacter mobilis]AGX88465.1 hypothetical protein Cenrod_2407 [Candidatus Symbiobacter mobilis CR]